MHEIYVDDKYKMGLKEFFDEQPLGFPGSDRTLAETARKDRWHPTEEMKRIVERYEQSVQDYGVPAAIIPVATWLCRSTCRSVFLLQSPKSQSSGSVSSSSKSSKSSPSKHSSTGEKAAGYNQTVPYGFGTNTAQKPEPSDSTEGDVKGFVMETVNTKPSQPSSSAAPLLGIGLVLAVLVMIWTGFRRKG